MLLMRITGIPRLTEFASAAFDRIFNPLYLWGAEKADWYFAMKAKIYTTQIGEKQSNTFFFFFLILSTISIEEHLFCRVLMSVDFNPLMESLTSFLMHFFPLSVLISWEMLELAEEIASDYCTVVFVDLCCYCICVSRGFFKFKKGAEHKQVFCLTLSITHHHGVIRVQALPVPRASLTITHFFVKKKNWALINLL